MSYNFLNELEREKLMNKMFFEIFNDSKHNIFDRSIDQTILELKEEINKQYEEHDSWVEMKLNQPKKYQEIEEKAEQYGNSLETQMYGYFETASYIEDEIFTLYEMKIIHAFRHLEINLKTLVSNAYSDKTISKQYKWGNLIQYLNSKSIDVKLINNYKEINQLRMVSNSLKHSDEIYANGVNGVSEFNQTDQLSLKNFETFYERIKLSPGIFLEDLSKQIYTDLYSFDASKIKEMAKSMALRMDKDNVINFTEELLKYYP